MNSLVTRVILEERKREIAKEGLCVQYSEN